MSRAALVISLVAALLVGISVGLVGGIVLSRPFHRRAPFAMGWRFPDGPRGGEPGRPARPPGPPLADAMPRLTRMLDLSDEQVARIRPKIDSTRREFAAVRESLRSRIEAELTPAQRERWRQLEAERSIPGEIRGRRGRAYRALPGPEGDSR